MGMREGMFSPTKTSKVLDEVFRERERQHEKFGQQNYRVPEMLMILGEEVGEANKAGLETYFPSIGPQQHGSEIREDYSAYRKELIQVAAVAVQMVETLDRNGR